MGYDKRQGRVHRIEGHCFTDHVDHWVSQLGHAVVVHFVEQADALTIERPFGREVLHRLLRCHHLDDTLAAKPSQNVLEECSQVLLRHCQFSSIVNEFFVLGAIVRIQSLGDEGLFHAVVAVFLDTGHDEACFLVEAPRNAPIEEETYNASEVRSGREVESMGTSLAEAILDVNCCVRLFLGLWTKVLGNFSAELMAHVWKCGDSRSIVGEVESGPENRCRLLEVREDLESQFQGKGTELR